MTKRMFPAVAVLVLFAFASYLAAQDNKSPERATAQSEPEQLPAGIVPHRGKVITPPISDSHRQGVHTNYKIFIPEGQKGPATIPATLFQFAETPASIACLYKIGAGYAGCNPTVGKTGGGIGGWGAIAVVDAYDHPFVASDLTTFESAFGLPAVNFTKVVADTSQCALFGGCPFAGLTPSCGPGTIQNANLFGWDVEIDLDTQYASAMAPSAHTYLVEACTQGLEDLLFAEEVAGVYVNGAGGGDISNSWGYPEACAQSSSCNGGWGGTLFTDDNYFFRYFWNKTTYFASAGDSPGDIIYPSTSPWVVSAGGTTINRSSAGNFVSESCWADSGGGFSAVESWANPTPSIGAGMGPWTDYQYRLFGGAPYQFPFRSTPDIAADADPASGVIVYVGDEGASNGFYAIGGTSVASPVLAGIINVSNNRLGQAPANTGGFYDSEELDMIYSQLFSNTAYKANWYDVKTGNNSHPAGVGYDQCTGVGTPRGKLGK